MRSCVWSVVDQIPVFVGYVHQFVLRERFAEVFRGSNFMCCRKIFAKLSVSNGGPNLRECSAVVVETPFGHMACYVFVRLLSLVLLFLSEFATNVGAHDGVIRTAGDPSVAFHV